VAGRIRSTENFNDLIGSRTHYLPVCNLVLQPPALPHGIVLN
jgi:hypothetical protein